MKDRVPVYPGRVRLMPVPGAENTYDMVRADQPTQEGTPLNKASLLKDATAELLDLPNTAVPDDAFRALVPQIGDIKITRRTDFGDKWLLCNGEPFDRPSYPKLAQLFPLSVNGAWDEVSTINGKIKKIYCYNNLWVAVGENASGNPSIFTTTNLNGPWEEKQLYSGTETLTDVFCYNNRWVAVGYTSTKLPVIYTTTSPTGTWTRQQLATTTYPLFGVYCYNGRWVAVGSTRPDNVYVYPIIYHTNSPTGSWTFKELPTKHEIRVPSVYCYNGTWVVVGRKKAVCYTTTNPSGTWTENTILDGNYACRGVYCYNGTWVSAITPSTSSHNAITLFYTRNPTATWTRGPSTGVVWSDNVAIFCYNGIHAVASIRVSDYFPVIYTTTALSSDGSFNENAILEKNIGQPDVGLFCYNGIWAASLSVSSTIICSPVHKLPEISLDGAYAYIKAKE